MFRKKKQQLRCLRIDIKFTENGRLEIRTRRGYLDRLGVHRYVLDITELRPLVVGREDSVSVTWDAEEEVMLGA